MSAFEVVDLYLCCEAFMRVMNIEGLHSNECSVVQNATYDATIHPPACCGCAPGPKDGTNTTPTGEVVGIVCKFCST